MVKLTDYKPFPFSIPKIFIDLSIHENHVQVISTMEILKKSKTSTSLILNGIDIEIDNIFINECILSSEFYEYKHNKLTINNIIYEKFELKITSFINPFKNTSLEGLYLSGSVLTTQCEAEGFRRITFHPDRPDVLSKYTVRIESDIKKYPILLANGNRLSSRKISEEKHRHEVFWEDPFPKPSYLFALVAGKLEQVSEIYKSKTNKSIKINIYVEEGDSIYTKHAINSLKKAMAWEEKVYNLEYDLDEYNIVAIRHFNMGAMENKGLNIFNSKLVLANSNITTDQELERIESVIAHEYFHNWTGNRITCRDWFQLSLKEGLTVFRDQSFTSDLHSETVKRIEDVSLLRKFQFKEDSGPTAHPVKPNEYISIDNFYTTTIYEKGAEIIRMIHTLLGEKNFMAGIRNYVESFDGCAATTEDFIYSMFDGAINNGADIKFDIKQFINWYYVVGTPYVSIKRDWDSEKGRLIVSFKQINKSQRGSEDLKSLVIPIKLSLLFEGSSSKQEVLILDKEEKVFNFNNLPKNKKAPILSIFRNFSAPVNWESDLSINEHFHLIENDNDLFSRWNSVQFLIKKTITNRASKNPNSHLEKSLISSFSKIINDFKEIDRSFISLILTIPTVSELELSQKIIDPIAIYDACIYLSSLIGQSLSNSLLSLLNLSHKDLDKDWPYGQDDRRLIGVTWQLLLFAGNVDIRQEILKSVSDPSMTLSKAALNSLKEINCIEREEAMKTFYDRWKDNPVVLDTWFNLESSIPRKNSLEIVQNLLRHPRFDPIAPNSIRAVLGGFTQNIKSFHAKDGSGYLFMAKQIILIDQRNPITASRLAKVFSQWESYINPNSQNMLKAIKLINESKLSTNTREVVELMIGKTDSP